MAFALTIAVLVAFVIFLPEPFGRIIFGTAAVAYVGRGLLLGLGDGHRRAGYLDGRIKVGRLRRWVYEWRISTAERAEGKRLAQLEVEQAIADILAFLPNDPTTAQWAYYSELRRIFRFVAGEAWGPARTTWVLDEQMQAELQKMKGERRPI